MAEEPTEKPEAEPEAEGKKLKKGVKPSKKVGELSEKEKDVDKSVLLEWDSWEYLYHNRGVGWYIIAGFIAAALIAYALITQAWTMAVVIALLAGVVYLYAHEPPKLKHVMITKLGVHTGDEIYPFSHLSSFWFIIEHDIEAVCFETLGLGRDVIVIQLGGQDPVKIRKVLLPEIPEAVGRVESALDKLTRFLKL